MKLNGRTVIDPELDGVDFNDYPDFCDAYVSSARWEDTGELLTDNEIDALNDQCRDEVYDLVMDFVF